MGKRLDTQLSEEDRLALEQVVRKSPDWRSRERAQTLTGLASAVSAAWHSALSSLVPSGPLRRAQRIWVFAGSCL